MARELCVSLERHERRGRTIAIKVRLDDFSTVTRARTIERPTCDARTVGEVAVELLRRYSPPRAVRLLGVRVAGFADQRDSPVVAREGERTEHRPAQLALPLGRQ
jgi:DNA polymerase IV